MEKRKTFLKIIAIAISVITILGILVKGIYSANDNHYVIDVVNESATSKNEEMQITEKIVKPANQQYFDSKELNYEVELKNIMQENFETQVAMVIDTSYSMGINDAQNTAKTKAKELASNLNIAAENMHFKDSGAYTGEVSVEMLKEIGVEWVILGHSERRQYFGETDETVNAKMLQVLKNDMTPIVCVGETLEQYEAGTTKDVVKTQVVAAYKDVCPKCASRSVIAYEPVWAIGTGKTATNEIAQDVCGYIRSVVAELYGQEVADQVRIQYGGSVKPEGLKALLEQPDIDGALVGGASLVEDSYKAMIAALD